MDWTLINVLRIIKIQYICPPKFLLMYAIVEIAGQQFKVSKSDKLFVNRIPEKEG